jgi:hypothetical protein
MLLKTVHPANMEFQSVVNGFPSFYHDYSIKFNVIPEFLSIPGNHWSKKGFLKNGYKSDSINLLICI